MDNDGIGEKMKTSYEKKDITASPEVKVVKKVKPILPEGVELYEKRGLWHLVWANGHEIFTTKEEALTWPTK